MASAASVSGPSVATGNLETFDQEINDPMFIHILVVGVICIVFLMILLHYRQKYKD